MVEQAGTRQPRLRIVSPVALWTGYALVLLAIAIVGATSPWIKQQQEPLLPLLIDEFTSVFMVFVTTPVVWWLTQRAQPSQVGWSRSIAAHVVGLFAFASLHVSGMLLLRQLICLLAGIPYVLESNWLVDVVLYEGRKDVLTYAALVALAILFSRFMQRAPAPVTERAQDGPVRIVHSDGPRTVWIKAEEILWIEAAGNYVELVLASRKLLQRQSLSTMAETFADAGFLRVHRSRLVNPAHVVAIAGNNNGDFTLTMTDGREISGSRRFRHKVTAALQA